MTKSLHADRRIIRKNTGPAHRKLGSFGGNLEDIDEKNNSCFSPSNILEETIAPVIPVDDFSSEFKNSRFARGNGNGVKLGE